MASVVVGVMGPGEGARAIDQQRAYRLGQLIAQQGWVLLTGGRNVGVMAAASQGAKQAQGLTIGILPTSDCQTASPDLDLAIVTGMGSARNSINVLSSRVVVTCGMGAGTAAEVALALKARKPVILLGASAAAQAFFRELTVDRSLGTLAIARSPENAIEIIQQQALV